MTRTLRATADITPDISDPGPATSVAQPRLSLVRRLLTNPIFYLLAPVFASAIVWMVPGTSDELRGFTTRADGSLEAWLLLVVFYLVTATLVWLGFRLGRIVGPSERLVEATNTAAFDRRFSLVLTVFASIGVLYSVYLVQQQASILDVLGESQGNQLKEAIGGVAGVATLRYTAAIAAPVALYVWRFRGGRLAPAIWNVLLLVTSSLFSSRLSFIMAVVVLVFIVVHLVPAFKIRPIPLVLMGSAVLGGLVAFNYFRNARFYEALGVTDPVSMNFYQVAAYLGSPFQVSLGVADGIANRGYSVASDPVGALALVVPTFLRPDGVAFGSNGSFAAFVQVAPNLSTNSAFGDTFADYGWWGLIYVVLTLALAGYLAGFVSKFRSLVIVAGAVVCYGLAEVWRLFLFPSGLAVYLLLSVLAATIIGLTAREKLPLDSGRSTARR
jgi:hypothetical protein